MEPTILTQGKNIDIILTRPSGFQIDIDDAPIEEPVENVFASSNVTDSERA